MSKLLNVSSSPHVRSNETTQSIMVDVAIAMLPATAFGVFQFGLHALLVLIVTIAACVLSEYVFEKITKRPCTISDFSAVVTGMILALNMPPEIALWIPALGGVFAIIVVKQLYGGLGQNFMNPADFLYRPDVCIYSGRLDGSNPSGSIKGRRECRCSSYVYW